MVTLIRNLIFTLVALCFMQTAWSQTSTPDPSISLDVDAISTTTVTLSWITPANAVSCDIVYSTHYNTSIHSISNFSADSIVLSRNIPVGPEEVFVIRFIKPSGDTITDVQILKNTYGGIVLVVEDIFAQTIVDMCNGNTEGIEQLYFLNDCIVAPIGEVCNISSIYMANQNQGFGRNSTYVIDPEAFVDNLVTELQGDLADPVTGVYQCDDLVSDTLIGVDGDVQLASSTTSSARQAKPVTLAKPFIQLSPNPCTDRLILQTGGAEIPETMEVFVRNMYGKVVYHGNHPLESGQDRIPIETSSWAAGAYMVSILGSGDQQHHKILKY